MIVDDDDFKESNKRGVATKSKRSRRQVLSDSGRSKVRSIVVS